MKEGDEGGEIAWVGGILSLFSSLSTVYECKYSNYQFHSASMAVTEMANIVDRTFSQCGREQGDGATASKDSKTFSSFPV